MKNSQIVEAILFASDAPLKAEEIARADELLDEDQVEEALRELETEYAEMDRAFRIEEVAEGFQIVTLPEFAPYLERFDTVPRPSRLSGPALETLAIIAYRQPIGRIEIEYIRGVGSAGVIRTLQDRGVVEVVGRGEGIGRPLLYGTTTRFLEHFGFNSLDDLPRPEELPVVLRDNPPIGEDDAEDDVPMDQPVGIAPAQGDLDFAEEDADAEEGGRAEEIGGDGASAGEAEDAAREVGHEDAAEPTDAEDAAEDAGTEEVRHG